MKTSPKDSAAGNIRLASVTCGVNNRISQLPTEKSVRSSDRLASFAGGKAENEATW